VRHGDRAEWSRSGVYGAVSRRGYLSAHCHHWLASHWLHRAIPHFTRGAGAPPLPLACRSSGQGWENPARCRSSLSAIGSRTGLRPSCCCQGQQRLRDRQAAASGGCPPLNVGVAVGAQRA